jgi:hypothetical protein
MNWRGSKGVMFFQKKWTERKSLKIAKDLVMHRGALIAAICVGLPIQVALSEDAHPITNVTINMIKHGGRGRFQIDAKITNPNDFAVFDVRVNCDIRDRRGNKVASYASTITDAIQAKEVRTIRRLDIEAWPDRGRTALCDSLEAKRLPDR